MPQRRLGWQPSRFLTDRAEAERAFQLAQQLGSVNAAAQELGTTWPSLRKAFQRHGLGMPTRNPEAVRSGRSPRPASAAAGRQLRPWIRSLWRSTRAPLPTRERPAAELHEWVRRDKEYAMWGRQRGGRAKQRGPGPLAHQPGWAIIRRVDRAHRLADQRASRLERRRADPN